MRHIHTYIHVPVTVLYIYTWKCGIIHGSVVFVNDYFEVTFN